MQPRSRLPPYVHRSFPVLQIIRLGRAGRTSEFRDISARGRENGFGNGNPVLWRLAGSWRMSGRQGSLFWEVWV